VKGLDREELRVMQVIARGFWLGLYFCEPGALERLKKRRLVGERTVDCGAPVCPGHPELHLTQVGALVLSAVTKVGI
jgi:hypothetical protein